MKSLNKYWGNVLNYIYPPRCPLCGALGEAEVLCQDCASFAEHGRVQKGIQKQSFQLAFVDELYFWAPYEGPVKTGIQRMKFGGIFHLADLYGRWLREVCTPSPQGIVTWVPPDKASLQERGVDLPGRMARAFCEGQDIVLAQLLQKDHHTLPQHQLTREERKSNLSGAYSVKGSVPLEGACVYLIDDVATTGATLNECAKTLKIFGAEKVIGVCFAATPEHPREGTGKQ